MSIRPAILWCALLASGCGRLFFQHEQGALDAPTIEGETSAGHLDLFWRWSTPTGTSTFRWWVDGGAPATVALDVTQATYLAAGEGPHTIQVQACNVDGECSLPASFTTTVELIAQDRPPAWRGVRRPAIATTPLSNLAGVLCAECAGSGSGASLALGEAGPRLVRALGRSADGVELTVSSAMGALCVGADEAAINNRAGLAEVLAVSELAAADAVVVLDVREDDEPPDAFARALLDALDARREDVVRNGRPVWVRASRARAAYLAAIRTEAGNHPFVSHYLRYHLAFDPTELTAPSTFAAAVDAAVAGAGLDGVVLAPNSPNLLFGTTYARAHDLAVTLGPVDPSAGDVLTGALREEADALSSRYRVDRARSIVEETNTVLYVAPSREIDDTQLRLHRADAVATETQTRPVGRAATATLYGTPSLSAPSPAGPLFGPALAYDRTMQRALDAWDADVPAGRRLLIVAAVRFADLEEQVILTKAQTSGWLLELKQDGGFPTRSIDFGVHDGTDFVRHRYPITGAAHPAGNLRTDRAYLLIGVWDGARVTLYVDGVPVQSPPAATAITSNDVPIFAGADPESTEPTQARFYFSGEIQVAGVLDWIGAPAGPGEVND